MYLSRFPSSLLFPSNMFLSLAQFFISLQFPFSLVLFTCRTFVSSFHHVFFPQTCFSLPHNVMSFHFSTSSSPFTCLPYLRHLCFHPLISLPFITSYHVFHSSISSVSLPTPLLYLFHFSSLSLSPVSPAIFPFSFIASSPLFSLLHPWIT